GAPMETFSTRSLPLSGPTFSAARSARTVFVLAPPCSGTDVLRGLLAGHPRLLAPPDLELLSFATLEERSRAFAGRAGSRLEGLHQAVAGARGCGLAEAQAIVIERERQGMTTAGFYGLLLEWLGGRALVDQTPSYSFDPELLERVE